MGYQRVFFLILIGFTTYSTHAEVPRHVNRYKASANQAYKFVSAQPPITLESILQSIAMETAQQVEERLREIVRLKQAEGIRLIQQALDQMIEKNLSPKEIAILTAVLEMATDDQIQAAIGDVAQAQKGERVRAWLGLASAIEKKVSERWKLIPEVKALKILARQTITLVRLTPEGKQQFRTTQKTFKESLNLLGDRKLDGKGVAKLFSSALSLSKFVVGESLRDVKAAVNPVEFRKTLLAVGVLTNAAANHEPTSKMMVRGILDRELENDRIVANDDGSPNWPRTIEKLAALQPQDARAVTNVLAEAKVISNKEAQFVHGAITRAEAGHRTVRDFALFFENNQKPKNQLEFQDQVSEMMVLTEQMKQRDQIGEDVAFEVQRAGAFALAGSNAIESSRMILEALKNPITRRNLGMATLPAQSPTVIR